MIKPKIMARSRSPAAMVIQSLARPRGRCRLKLKNHSNPYLSILSTCRSFALPNHLDFPNLADL